MGKEDLHERLRERRAGLDGVGGAALGRPQVKLVEVDVDTEAYNEGHAPGAIAWNWSTHLQDKVTRDILSKEQISELLSASGISNDDLIILYGDNNNWFAAYAYWLLKIYGHEDVRLMDGGRKKWLAEGRPADQRGARHPAHQRTVARAADASCGPRGPVLKRLGKRGRPRRRALTPGVQRRAAGPSGTAETRPAGRAYPRRRQYSVGAGRQRGRHLQVGATSSSALRGKGITPDKDVITYCRIGERSSHSWFVLQELLGYPDVQNYDGSWTEWGSMVGVPIEQSPNQERIDKAKRHKRTHKKAAAGEILCRSLILWLKLAVSAATRASP